MKIKELFYDNIGIARAIIESDSGKEYNVSIDAENIRTWCSCPYYVFNNISCKHIIFLMNNIEFDKMTKKENLEFLQSGCDKIDELLGGGIPYGIVTAIFGEPTAGKTVFSKQCGLANIAKTGKKTILIETEGLRDYDTKVLLYKFMNRYNLDKKTIDNKFIIKHTLGDPQMKSIQKLLQMFGVFVKFEISKNGKYSVNMQECVPSITEKELEETNMIILDSLTKPVKDSVGSETQNLPARAQLIERLFGRLYHYAMIHNLAIIVIHHACHDKDTLTLTKEKGLVNYEEVKEGDYVLALDENGKSVWSKVLQKYVSPYIGEMVHIHGKSIDQMVTPNHRLLYNFINRRRQYKGLKYRTADNVPKSGLPIPKSSQIKETFINNQDHLIELATEYPKEFIEGWYLAEGYLDKKELKGSRWGCRFCLNKNDLKWVEPTLKLLNLKYCKSKEIDNETQVGIYKKSFYESLEKFGRGSHDKTIPSTIIESYSRYQLKALLFGYLLGDGRNTYKNSWSYTTVSKRLVSDLITLCSKIGYSITYKETKSTFKGLNRVKKTDGLYYYGYIRPINKGWGYNERIQYEGPVWCLTTEHSNFMISRNGKISYSGNSVNPITPFGRDLGKPYGGDPILYNSKYALQFIDATSAIKKETGWGEEARRIKLLRRPDEPYTGELIPVRLKKDYGFSDG